MLPRNKLALIKVAASRLHLEDEDYRAILGRVAGVASSRDLGEASFNQLMEEFARLGFTSEHAARNLGHREDRATPNQIAAIRDLWLDCTDRTGSEAGFRTWLEKHHKVSDIRFLDKRAATKVISALKKWKGKKGSGWRTKAV